MGAIVKLWLSQSSCYRGACRMGPLRWWGLGAYLGALLAEAPGPWPNQILFYLCSIQCGILALSRVCLISPSLVLLCCCMLVISSRCLASPTLELCSKARHCGLEKPNCSTLCGLVSCLALPSSSSRLSGAFVIVSSSSLRSSTVVGARVTPGRTLFSVGRPE